MSLIYLSSKTCLIESNLDTPIKLKEGEEHYLTLLNLNYSNCFANTSTQYNTIGFQYTGTSGSLTIEETLPSNRIMTLEEIYEWAGKASSIDGDQIFKFEINTQTGQGEIKPVDNAAELMISHGYTGCNINQVDFSKTFFKSPFYYNPTTLTFDTSTSTLTGRATTTKEPTISEFNQLFVTTPLVQNTGRTVVNGNCMAVPMIAAVSSAASPFEYVQYTAFQPMKCKISTTTINNLQFNLKTEFNTNPEIIEGSDVEFSVLVKIE